MPPDINAANNEALSCDRKSNFIVKSALLTIGKEFIIIEIPYTRIYISRLGIS